MQIFEDNWESDISVIEKIKGNLDGIFSIIKVVCRQEDKEKVKDLISKALKKNPIEGCEIE